MKYFYNIIIVFVFLSCKTETEVNTNVISKQLPNNKLLEVIKTEKTDTRRGVFSHSNYGTTYSFKYQFTINKNEIIWKDKGSAVPQEILFCKDSIYIKYLQKKSIAYQAYSYDTIKNTVYKDTIVEKYDKFIDNRYFFKWFGKYAWVSISNDIYNAKKSNCKAYSIPNDNDFKNIKNQKKGYVNYEVLKDSVIYHDVFYNGINLYKREAVTFRVKEVDPKAFVALPKKYGKDNSHIFYKGHKLRKRDVHTFKVLNNTITIDKYGAYLRNKIIRGSHGLSFKLINDDRYGIDNNQMCFLGRNFYTVLKGVDKKSAKVVDCKTCSYHYVMDKNHVYYEGELIKKANTKAFTVMNYDYSKDDKYIFYKYEFIKEADYNSFEILKKYKKEGNTTFYAEDKYNKYGCSNHNNELIIKKRN